MSGGISLVIMGRRSVEVSISSSVSESSSDGLGVSESGGGCGVSEDLAIILET